MEKEGLRHLPKGTPKDVHEGIDAETLRVLAEVAKSRGAERAYFWGTILGIGVGALFCLSGFVITILGLAGSIEWIFEAADFKSRLTNAGPGVFFALLGMVVLWRYKPRVKDTLDLGPLSSTHVLEMNMPPDFLLKELEQADKEEKEGKEKGKDT